MKRFTYRRSSVDAGVTFPDQPVVIEKENLQKRAFLNMVTGLIDYVTKIGVSFFLNPLIVKYLGTNMYGVWQVIGQLNSYMVTADVRSATSLKWMLSRDRSTKSDAELKRMVSTAMYANLVFVPLYAVVGIALVWAAPYVSSVDPAYFSIVRWATALLVISFIVTQFFFLFESVLQGMNLAFKRIGIRSVITIAGGLATALVLYWGYGILGLSFVKIMVSLVTGVSFWWIVVKIIPWFGFVKVPFGEVVGFIKMSGWFMLMKLADMANQSIDLILLGYFAGAELVAVYSFSKFIMTALMGLVRTLSSALSIGIAKFIGEGAFDKIQTSRAQILRLQWVIITASGGLICLINEPFVLAWTGNKELYVGDLNNLLIVFLGVLTTVQQVDSGIISSFLDIRRKIFFSVLAAVVTIGTAAALIPIAGTTGLLAALLLGSLIITTSNALIVNRFTGSKNAVSSLFFSRIAITGYVVLLGSSYLGHFIEVSGWIPVIVISLVSFPTLFAILWLVGLNRSNRAELMAQLKKIRKK